MREYTVESGAITCHTCQRTSHVSSDVYFRYCSTCGFLGPEIRWRWDQDPQYLHRLVEQFGQYKKVIHMGTGRTYLVPVEWILTQGIRGIELARFPECQA